MTSWGTPIGSIAKAYFPGDGSETLSHAVRLRSMPVFRLGPAFIPGTMVSVGWSKLCHKKELELDDFTTKLPVSRSWPIGLGKNLGKEGEDQMGVELPEVMR
ncbi:hypothetical protein IEQ34_001731 [Dendrobium chrysotoxum]|uniref:Uncharacterized protein n=1 Tax=Dendrobium chrysotoxum TaxID=161865 RepID=A0AAV7HQ14_DENCH|nr:hypothetical protein IEQ34_001731 [Dendrobium chrysotoxum]